MPVGISIGMRMDGRSGLRIGTGYSSVLVGVTRDATSGIYCPASAAEWTTVLAAAGITSGGPSALYLCQEASGNLADSIGSFTLTQASTAPTYQSAVTGWTRTGVALADNATTTLSSTDAGLPSVNLASQLLLAYVKMPAAAPAAQRAFGAVGATVASARISAVPRMQFVTAGGTTVTGPSASPINAVRPMIVQVNRSGTPTAGVTTDQEVLETTTLGTVAGKQILWGATTVNAAAQTLMYLASFHTTAAEWTTAQKRTLLQTLGWTVSF